MVFMKADSDNNYTLTKPLSTFVFISMSIGLGVMLFVLLLYGLIKAITSGGFGELKSTIDNDGKERIDDNDDLEDA